MAARTPLVLADDGLIQQLQSGDTLAGDASAQLLVQNNALIRLGCALLLVLTKGGGDPPPLDDNDVESLIAEMTP